MPAGDASSRAVVPRFEFATAQRIVFGAGTAAELPAIVSALGRRVFLVASAGASRDERLRDALAAKTDELQLHHVRGEPTVDAIDAAATQAREFRADVVVAFGGGSAIDAGKAIAGLATNPGVALDYLEVVGRGKTLAHAALPLIAVPTTAGTGAEVTRNAVLAVPAAGVKASLRSPFLLPRVALVDPELAITLPAAVTAATGMDALTQLLEAFFTPRANPMTDALCRAALPGVPDALRRAIATPNDLAARSTLALAALHSGLALANAGLGTVHGFAAVLGGRFSAPHGAVCAALLPSVLAANLAALRARQPDSVALAKMAEIARAFTGDDTARAEAGGEFCAALTRQLEIPRLSRWGVTDDAVDAVVRDTAQASSTKANPIALTTGELAAALRAAL